MSVIQTLTINFKIFGQLLKRMGNFFNNGPIFFI